MNWYPVKRVLGLLIVLLLFVALVATGRMVFDKVHSAWRVPGFPVSIPLAGVVLLVAVAADSLFGRIVSAMGALLGELDGSEDRPKTGNT